MFLQLPCCLYQFSTKSDKEVWRQTNDIAAGAEAEGSLCA
ncbi:hypothetical protein LEMLEM_LOCUS17039 [Lemmus lemmus]